MSFRKRRVGKSSGGTCGIWRRRNGRRRGRGCRCGMEWGWEWEGSIGCGKRVRLESLGRRIFVQTIRYGEEETDMGVDHTERDSSMLFLVCFFSLIVTDLPHRISHDGLLDTRLQPSLRLVLHVTITNSSRSLPVQHLHTPNTVNLQSCTLSDHQLFHSHSPSPTSNSAGIVS